MRSSFFLLLADRFVLEQSIAITYYQSLIVLYNTRTHKHIHTQARSRAEAVVRAAAATEQLQQMEIQMEDGKGGNGDGDGDGDSPLQGGKVYARAEGERNPV